MLLYGLHLSKQDSLHNEAICLTEVKNSYIKSKIIINQRCKDMKT